MSERLDGQRSYECRARAPDAPRGVRRARAGWRWLAPPLAVSALFSGSYVAGKLVAPELDPLAATFVRYVFALATLAALVPRFGAASLRAPARDWPALAGLGITGIVGYHGLFFASLRYTSAGNTAIINALSPALTALAAAALLGERLRPRAYAGIAVACAGAVLLVSAGQPQRIATLDLNRGDLLMLGAVGCWVCYALLLDRLLARYGGFTLTFHATLSGVLVLAVLTAGDWPALRGTSATVLAALGYMGVFASGIGYLVYALSVAAIGPTRTSGFVYCTVPVGVALLALVVLDEPLTLLAGASIALVVAGLRLLGGNN